MHRSTLCSFLIGFVLVLATCCEFARAQSSDDELLPGVNVEFWQHEQLVQRRVAYELGGDWGNAFLGSASADAPVTVVWNGWWLPDGRGDHQWLLVGSGNAELSLDSKLITRASLSPTTPAAFGPLASDGDWLPFRLQCTFTSSSDQFQVSWSGPNFSAEPLPGYRLKREFDSTLEQYELGRAAIKSLRCAACHQQESWPKAEPAPSLKARIRHTDSQWLRSHLSETTATPIATTDPQPVRPSDRKMPYFHLDEREVENLLSYLESAEHLGLNSQDQADNLNELNEPNAEPVADPTQALRTADAALGWQIVASRGCLACHASPKSDPESQLQNAPQLRELASRRTPEFLTRWLQNPLRVDPSTRMPLIKLSPQELIDVVAALTSPHSDSPTPQFDPVEVLNDDAREDTINNSTNSVGGAQDPISQGKAIYQRLRCAACHDSSDTQTSTDTHDASDNRRVIPIENRTAIVCFDASSQNADSHDRPSYRVSDEIQQAIRTFLTEQPHATADSHNPSINVPELLETHRCFACHSRSGRLASVKSAALESGHLGSDFEAGRLVAPTLDGIGDKFREGIFEQVLEHGSHRREWLTLRMPIYRFTDDERRAIAQWFRAADRFPTSLVKEANPATAEAAFVHGSKLVTSSGFGCTSCHAIGNHTPVGVLPHALGPALNEVSSRYERDWFDRWVRDPARLVPNMEMPSIRTPVRGVLNDDVTLQLDAVWQSLSRPGFDPPKSDPHRLVQHSGSNHDARAFVIHDVMRHQNRVWIAPEVLGLANRHNMMFDLESGGLVLWWIGDVGRQYTEGKSWVWYPGGDSLFTAESTSPPTPEWSLVTDQEVLLPAPRGQLAAVTDQWRYAGPQLIVDQRWHFGSNGNLSIQVQQTWEPCQSEVPTANLSTETLNTKSDHQESLYGVRRTLNFRGLPPNSQMRLNVRSVAGAARLVQISERTWRVDAANSWVFKWDSPSASDSTPAASLSADSAQGLLLVEADRNGSAALALEYLTGVLPDQIEPIVTVDMNSEISILEAQPRSDIVPGFAAELWGESIDWMPTAMSWGSDGVLFVTSLDGRVWRATDLDGDSKPDRINETREQLAAPFGLNAGLLAEPNSIDVIHKTALLRLYDEDQDGITDRVRRLASGWGVTADYHDWAVGLPRDADGAYWIALSCQQDQRSRAAAALRGEVLRLVPDPDQDQPTYRIEPVSAGHRFPIGIARSKAGDVFVTDNQGNFNPFNELNLVERGQRYGFLNSWERAAGLTFPETPPSIAIPHPWTRSVNGICFLEAPSDSNATDSYREVGENLGAEQANEFGPFTGHLIGCEYDTQRLVRMSIETVEGVTQGAVYPFSSSSDLAGSFLLGPISCAVSPNNELIIGTIRDSGWGGADNIGRLVRLKFDAESLPAGIAEIRALHDGFHMKFTRPLEPSIELSTAELRVSSARRESTPDYGGPDLDQRTEEIAELAISEDRRSADVVLTKPLRPGFVYAFSVDNSKFTTEFFPSEAFYTLHVVPKP